MKWKGGRRSDNVEDRRRGGRGAKAGAGGIGILVLVAVVTYLSGGSTGDVVQAVVDTSQRQSQARRAQQGGPPPQNDETADFVSVVLADTEDTWTALFAKAGQRYQKPKLVIFEDSVHSACGMQSSAVGPFYCPADSKVYLDLVFFRELDRRFGAPGDFAQAYVVAHEIGHHIQNLTGTSRQVHAQRRRLSKVEGNKLSVLQELQADCYAGVWAHHAHRTRQILEKGDVEEGLRAAAAIGDDTLQKRARGRVSPESWTHGSSAQRVKWFRAGLASGKISDCNTFR